MEKPVGLTRDKMFQIGARRTYPVSVQDAWELIISDRGRKVWLGESADLAFVKAAEFSLADGTTGKIGVFRPESHIRLTWHPSDWPKASTVQVRVIPAGAKTIIAFHQENLPDAKTREVQRKYFSEVLDRFEDMLKNRRKI